MNKLMDWVSKPVGLMLIAVFLWMSYPPLVNQLLNSSSVLYVSAFAHSIGGFSTLIVAFYVLIIRDKIRILSLLSSTHIKKVAYYTGLAGLFSVLNHFLLYTALKSSEEFDVVAILVFETWPILFFIIDSKLRKEKRKITINDYIFTGAAFAGFIILTIPNLDFADILLLNSPMINTIVLAALGGLAMAITCYFRMKNMDVWSDLSTSQQIPINSFRRGLLTEAGARTISGVILTIILFISGEKVAFPETSTLFLLLFVGIFILAIGGLLYDLSVFSADSASVGALWYLMPVGAIAILALMQGRLINQYEAVASVLIVSSNIFLALRYPLKSSLLFLFVSICLIGIWILFAPILPINNYYSLLSVSTIFFVLLATFALERATALNREKEDLLVEFNEQVTILMERIADTDKCEYFKLYAQEIRLYTFLNLHSFIRAFRDISHLRNIQKKVEKLKQSMLFSSLQRDKEIREYLLRLFKTGDKLQTMESDRIAPEEFIILIFLGTANIFFSLVFRPESLSSGLFSLIVTASIIYLLLIIIERDKNTQIRHDHALNVKSIVKYLEKYEDLEIINESAKLEHEIRTTLDINSTPQKTRSYSYWTFSVFVIIFLGFGYSFFYSSLKQNQLFENSPLSLVDNKKNIQVNIALLDWPSAQIKAHILKDIINKHTELKASTVPISSVVAFKQMDETKGMIDIYPELWVENNKKLIRRYVNAYGTVSLGKTSVEGYQGLCYTSFTDRENLFSEKDFLSEKVAHLFDLSGDNKGNIWIGTDGWDSTKIEKRRLAGYGFDKYYNFDVYDIEVMKLLLKRNNEKKVPTLFFCYYPSDVFMDKNVYFAKNTKHDKNEWKKIMMNKDINSLESSTSWPTTNIKIAFRTSLIKDHKELNLLLNNFYVSNDDLIDMLSMIKKGKSIEKVSKDWIENNNEKILEWLIGFKFKKDKI